MFMDYSNIVGFFIGLLKLLGIRQVSSRVLESLQGVRGRTGDAPAILIDIFAILGILRSFQVKYAVQQNVSFKTIWPVIRGKKLSVFSK